MENLKLLSEYRDVISLIKYEDTCIGCEDEIQKLSLNIGEVESIRRKIRG